MKQINRKRLNNIVKSIIGFLIIYVIAFSCTSCKSQSGQLANTPKEKVVILDSKARTNDDNLNHRLYVYKVKRIEKGVVDFVYKRELFEVGDTIYHRFQ